MRQFKSLLQFLSKDRAERVGRADIIDQGNSPSPYLDHFGFCGDSEDPNDICWYFNRAAKVRRKWYVWSSLDNPGVWYDIKAREEVDAQYL